MPDRRSSTTPHLRGLTQQESHTALNVRALHSLARYVVAHGPQLGRQLASQAFHEAMRLGRCASGVPLRQPLDFSGEPVLRLAYGLGWRLDTNFGPDVLVGKNGYGVPYFGALTSSYVRWWRTQLVDRRNIGNEPEWAGGYAVEPYASILDFSSTMTAFPHRCSSTADLARLTVPSSLKAWARLTQPESGPETPARSFADESSDEQPAWRRGLSKQAMAAVEATC